MGKRIGKAVNYVIRSYTKLCEVSIGDALKVWTLFGEAIWWLPNSGLPMRLLKFSGSNVLMTGRWHFAKMIPEIWYFLFSKLKPPIWLNQNLVTKLIQSMKWTQKLTGFLIRFSTRRLQIESMKKFVPDLVVWTLSVSNLNALMGFLKKTHSPSECNLQPFGHIYILALVTGRWPRTIRTSTWRWEFSRIPILIYSRV